MFSRNSSSFHIINADKPMGMLRRLLYFPFNRINNKLPLRKNVLYTVKQFTCKYPDENGLFCEKDSPSRCLSNLFWLNLPWGSIQRELGNLYVFDIGCGRGKYALMFQDWSGGRLSGYTGLDFQSHEQWDALQKQHPFVHFKQGDASMVDKYIPENTNVFLSQSALEHIENDLLYFRHVHKFVASRRCNTIQVHLIPSPACLDLYGFHGVRQYTPRTIAGIVRIFEPDAYAVLYFLGGAKSNLLHMNYITHSIASCAGDLRNSQTETYKVLLREAIENDMINPHDNAPSFYALVIHSFFKQKLF